MTTQMDTRIREHLAYAYDHAPAVRDMMRGAGVTPADIQTATDLAKLPVTSKDRLIELQQQDPPFGGLLAVPADSLSHIFISPGPIYDPQRAPGSGGGGLAALRACGFGKGDRVLNTFMYHLTPAGLLLDEGLRSIGCTVIPTGPGNTELQVMIALRLNATGFVGTPSFMATFFDAAQKMGINPADMPLKKAFFTAEPYPASLRQRFDGDYGMRTISAYGTADVGFIGYERAGVPGFCVSDSVYVEIVDPDNGQPVPPGEAGEIVVTVFDAHYPLVRFGTGDLGALDAHPHPGCEGGQHLAGLFGRSGGAIKVRGMFLHPNQLETAVSRIPEIKYAQAIITRQNNRDHVTLRVQLKPDQRGDHVPDALKSVVQAVARLKVDEVLIVEPGVIDPAQRVVKDERRWE